MAVILLIIGFFLVIFNSTALIKEKKKFTITLDKEEDVVNLKINGIENMLNQGLSVDEIADNLSIGKGEVLLIKELYK